MWLSHSYLSLYPWHCSSLPFSFLPLCPPSPIYLSVSPFTPLPSICLTALLRDNSSLGAWRELCIVCIERTVNTKILLLHVVSKEPQLSLECNVSIWPVLGYCVRYKGCAVWQWRVHSCRITCCWNVYFFCLLYCSAWSLLLVDWSRVNRQVTAPSHLQI